MKLVARHYQFHDGENVRSEITLEPPDESGTWEVVDARPDQWNITVVVVWRELAQAELKTVAISTAIRALERLVALGREIDQAGFDGIGDAPGVPNTREGRP